MCSYESTYQRYTITYQWKHFPFFFFFLLFLKEVHILVDAAVSII